MFLNIDLTPRECMFIDLSSVFRYRGDNFCLNLLQIVTHEDGARFHTGTHFRLRTTQTRNELAVNQCWFGIFEFMCDIPRKSKIRILINRTRDQCWNIRSCSKNLRKRIRKGGCCLNGDKMHLANVVSSPSQCLVYEQSRGVEHGEGCTR